MSLSDVRAIGYVRELNRKLKPGWSAHLAKDGRIYYCNHGTQTASWLPPAENWESDGSGGLPYGWEAATDKDGKHYFINHLNKTTTYEDPRKDVVDEVPQPRDVELLRHPDMGFGFVAGSEKPVIVRFVTEGGPSVDKLLPGDQILRIDGEDVKKAPREHVIELVRSCKHSVLLTVCQPHTANATRKSALLSAAKKAKLKNNPSRVRFAEGVLINGSPLLSPSSYSSESCIPFMPNVLKVFLENGQTKSFKYDSSTTIQDVLESLQQKLSLKCIEHFSLVVEHIKSIRRNKLTLLDPKESLARIAARPGAQHLRCLFRVTFVPKDAYDLLRKDPVSFEYLYMQCCNDVVQERFAPELKYDIALRLAALHIQQHALSNNLQGKLSVKSIERECGLERFVPLSLVETMKRKELRKLLSHFLKANQSLSAPGQKSLTALQAKLHYLKIISDLPSYGAKCFTTNLRDSNMETMILVSPKFGISQIPGVRNSMPLTLADIEELDVVLVFREDELSHRVDLQLKDPDAENIVLSLEDRDADELVLLLQGYYRLLTDKELPVHQERDRWAEDAAPPYHTQHRVQAAGWSYPNSKTDGEASPELSVDLSTNPTYKPSPQKVLTANGHLPNISGGKDAKKSDGPNVAMMDAVVRQLVTMDRNMNKMPDAPLSPSLVRAAAGQRGNLIGDANKNLSSPVLGGRGRPFNFRSVVSMEVMEDSEIEIGDKGNVPPGTQDAASCVEACNDEVIRRVTEMQQIVRSAEKYLTGHEEPPKSNGNEIVGTTTTTTATADGSPRLKAADSLLLLTQVGREADLETVHHLDVNTGGGGGGVVGDQNEPSGSDTDSLSTPTDSPSHRPQQQQQQQQRSARSLIGSSFGLHSPDNLPVALQQTSLQELLRRLQDERRVLPFPMAENGGFYLDPDIIDLTMIPPPATPDREGFDLPSAVSMPPTPFADRQTLEAELRALEAHFQKETRELEAASSYDPSQPPGFRPPGLPAPPTPVTAGNSGSGFNGVMDLPSPPPPPPQGWGSGDIDSFIASVTVPPPPEELRTEPVPFVALSPVVELTPEDISAFIIPPPPASSSSDSDVDMIARLQEAADSINEVVEGSGTLRGNRRRPTPPPGRFVLHLQNRFDGGGGTTKAALYAGDSSGYETQNSSILSYSDGVTNPLGAVTSSGVHPPPHGHYVTSAMTAPTTTNSATVDHLSGLRTGAISSMSDNASTVSGGSSTASGGTQADTEDSNAEDHNPRRLRPTNVCLKTATMTAMTSTVTSSHLVTNGISSPLREESAASSESEDAASVCHMSASSSDDGNEGATSPFRRQMSIPRSLTSPLVAKRAQWSQLPVLQRSQSLSSEQVSPGSGYTSPSGEQTSPRSLHSSSSGENIQPGNASSCGNSPTRSKANSTLVMEKSGHTGTILKSPHMSPARQGAKVASKGSVKPPLPPSPSQEIPRRVLVSPVDVKRLPANGSATIQVPKPVLPKSPNVTPNRSPLATSKRVASPSPADALVNGKLRSPAPSPTHSSRTSTPTRSPLPGSKLPRPKATLVGCGAPVVIDNSDVSSLKGSLVNGTDSSASSPSFHDSTSGGEDIFNFASTGLEDDVADLVNHEAPLQKAEAVVGAMVSRLDEVLDACGQEGQELDPDRDKLVTARDALAIEARRFVTASKLFVKSATESEEKLLVNLGLCVSLLDRMLRVTETLALNMGSPLQTQNLALKVRDVAATFVQATRAAAGAVGRPMHDPNMNILMQQATTLAAVLTALMRTLRAFNP